MADFTQAITRILTLIFFKFSHGALTHNGAAGFWVVEGCSQVQLDHKRRFVLHLNARTATLENVMKMEGTIAVRVVSVS